MTLEEAKSRFKDEIEGQGFYNDNEHREMAIAALEKQIPKKANGGHCPLCGEMLFWEGRVLLPTCPCGQRIDWSEDDDSFKN